jgi:hypothetical protein
MVLAIHERQCVVTSDLLPGESCLQGGKPGCWQTIVFING